MGVAKVTFNMLTAPSEAFEHLRVKGRAWFPVLVIIIFAAAAWIYYYQVVDFDWAMEDLVTSTGGDMSKAQKAEIIKMYQSMGANKMLLMSLGSIVIMVPIMFAIYGLYFLIASNIRNDNLVYSQCFTLAAWSSIVGSLSWIASMLQIAFASSNQIPQSAMKGLNLNDLILNLSNDHAWYTFASNFDLMILWSSALAAIGYKAWTNCKTTTAYVIGFIPAILIYGIWALIKVI